jgi:hypothetical protein
MTPIAFPSPGRYDIQKCTDLLHKSGPKTKSIFQSKSERFKDVGNDKLGPGFYNPLPEPRNRSFQLNIEQKWI